MTSFIMTYNQNRSIVTGELVEAVNIQKAIEIALIANESVKQFDGVTELYNGNVVTVYNFLKGELI